MRDSFRILAAARSSGEIREYPGLTIASAGVAFQMFNAAFLAGPIATDAELEQRILQAALHFQARGQEWAYWVCEDWMERGVRRRSGRIFDQYDLNFSTELPGMTAEKLLPPRRPLPVLDVRRVRSARTRADFCQIGSVCFHVPLVWFNEVFESDAVWDGFVGYVGYLDDEPVSTAATVVSSGAVGVYNVGTLPGHQRRGYGEAVMRYALEMARQEHGIERTILQSTPQGFRLYQRMGYRTVTKVTVYSS